MDTMIRRAIADDAEGIAALAQSLSAPKKIAERGEAVLEAEGFLLYPLAARANDKANYLERIVGSKHFWVACQGAQLVAFVMAYNFDELTAFRQKTANDVDVIEFFRVGLRFDPATVFVAQFGKDPTLDDHRLMLSLMERLVQEAGRPPAIIGEVAQSPTRNRPSNLMIRRLGARMLFTRLKDSEARVSGVFVRTLPLTTPL